ncbi:MAG TPA: NADH-quinone oxidoreductase subunit L, partial [Nitrospira sp.]
MWMALIPLCPAVASLIIALGGRWFGSHSHRIGVTAVTTSFLLSILGTFLIVTGGPVTVPLYTLLQSDRLTIDLGLYADGLAMALLLLVSGVSAIVHVFSSRYMQGDPRYPRFFGVIALFTSAMLLLVLSANLLLLYMSWEVMGLCSYLLISHWSERRSASQAATKAFLVNAVADVGLGFGVILTWSTFHTLDIRAILANAPDMVSHTVNVLSIVGLEWSLPVLFVIACLLFAGAVGKSAQFPFHVWLPFAMEAPTPVSALIHAATMVNAGVYLLIRLAPLYVLSPGAMTLVATIGGVTALFAGIVGLAQCDIKRILAYSTISQLGFMVLACGVGAFRAATFHLVSHGALKAYLFLSSGSAVTAATPSHTHHHAQTGSETRRGSWPLYGVSFLLALLPALLLFSEPYRTLWTSTGQPHAGSLYMVLGLATTSIAAYYFSSLLFDVFQKPIPLVWREAFPEQMARPGILSTSLMLGFLPIAAGLALFLAVLWILFTKVLVPMDGMRLPASDSLVQGLFNIEHLIVPLLLAAGGWGLAVFSGIRPRPSPAWVTASKNRLYVFFMNRGYVDEIYDLVVVRPMLRVARWAWKFLDVRVIDGAYRACAIFSLALARWLWQTIDVRGIDRGGVGFG